MKTRLLLILALSLALSSLTVAAPASAGAAAEMMECQHDMATIASLRMCVQHAVSMGHIDNQGVADALLAQLDAAQAALDRGQAAVAIDILQAFIATVQAQSGIHIVPEHAGHLVEHAQMVIAALGQ